MLYHLQRLSTVALEMVGEYGYYVNRVRCSWPSLWNRRGIQPEDGVNPRKFKNDLSPAEIRTGHLSNARQSQRKFGFKVHFYEF